MNFAITLSLAVFVASEARADMDIPVTKVTAYSGNCRYDRNGGGSKSASGELVRQHTVQQAAAGTAKNGYAVAAVPQARSKTAQIFRCFFKDDKNYPGVRFRAGDHYGKGSNGMEKYDASNDCVSNINSLSKPATTIVVEGSCGGDRPKRDTPRKKKKPRKVASVRRR